jgi:hypothetical protein
MLARVLPPGKLAPAGKLSFEEVGVVNSEDMVKRFVTARTGVTFCAFSAL